MTLVPLLRISIPEHLQPDPKFDLKSVTKRATYFKLAQVVKTKICFSFVALLIISFTFVGLVWSTGSIIHHCFVKDDTIYRSLSPEICIKANHESLTSNGNVFSGGTFAVLSVSNFILAILFYVCARSTVAKSMKLLAFGVKTSCYSLYSFVYAASGLLIGIMMADTLHQDPTLLPGLQFEGKDLYYWGYTNYPETVMGHTIRLLKNLGILAGLIKFLLVSIKDPFDVFCSLSNMMTACSGGHSFELPDPKYTTDIVLVKFSKRKNMGKPSIEEDYNIRLTLTALDRRGLLLERVVEEKESAPQPGFINSVKNSFKQFAGFRARGYENKVQQFLINQRISRRPLSFQEANELETCLIKLLLNKYTKRWPLFLLFTHFYVSIVLSIEIIRQRRDIVSGFGGWQNVTDIPLVILFVHLISTILTQFLVEFSPALFFCILSFGGALVEGFLMVKYMYRLILIQGTHYYIAPFLSVFFALIQLIAVAKLWRIILLIRNGKKLLAESQRGESPQPQVPIYVPVYMPQRPCSLNNSML